MALTLRCFPSTLFCFQHAENLNTARTLWCFPSKLFFFQNTKSFDTARAFRMHASLSSARHIFLVLTSPPWQDGVNHELPPEGTSSVPVQLVAHCWLRVQPTERHTWSAPLSLRDPPRDPSGSPCGKTWLINAGGRLRREEASSSAKEDDDPEAFFVWIRVHSPNGFCLTITFSPILTLHNELAMPVQYRVHYGVSNVDHPLERRGTVLPGDRQEHHSFSPEDVAYLFLRLPGFKWSTACCRIQADKRLNSDAELHQQLLLSDEADDGLNLAVRFPPCLSQSIQKCPLPLPNHPEMSPASPKVS